MTLYPSRLVLILLAASALTACSTYEPFADQPTEPARPNFPIRTPAQTPDQSAPQALPQDTTPAPQASPLPPVESRPLDAPAAPAPSTYQPQAPAYQPPAYQPPAYQPPPPVMQTVTKLTVTGKVVTIGGPPKTHKVKSGDNLDAIARDLGTTRKQLAEDNDLKSPFRIHPGDVLKGPSTEAKAYVVGQGDTLYAIAKRFNVTGQALADANDISIHTPLNAGKKLILPDGYKDKGPIKVETQVQIAGGPSAPRPTSPAQTYPSQTYPSTPQPGPETRPYTPPPEPARPTSVTTTTTKLSVTGKVVEIEGPPAIHVVEKGDAVDAIARGFDMTRQEFVKLNKLKEPYNIHPGDKLKGPPQTLKAYVVGQGDTLALIAKRFNVTPKALAAENDMKPTAALKPGKKLTLPDGFKDKGPIKETIKTVTETPAPNNSYTPPPYTPPPYTPPQTQPQLPSQPRPYTPGPTTPRPGPRPLR
ncbi:LysM peptidoglycan-binding domain-containing protein [Phenylobacterium aquaticum]|uniref:LysM peptidoglycan-binding domain-containing protein n=1 Tax=Phenylobacterium aquaticum TaxID=1763816 RepID=UPI001F5DE55E|nr:LysM peptidoglycan-binding domain-containing protein [Phenylobacterium aquaticum]MCI3133445.1 LysM peptidoglycan-binding domain-containing protein [Phenylobacterium aquaticum]